MFIWCLLQATKGHSWWPFPWQSHGFTPHHGEIDNHCWVLTRRRVSEWYCPLNFRLFACTALLHLAQQTHDCWRWNGTSLGGFKKKIIWTQIKIDIFSDLPSEERYPRHPYLSPVPLWSSRSVGRISVRRFLQTLVHPAPFLFHYRCRLQPPPWLGCGHASNDVWISLHTPTTCKL